MSDVALLVQLQQRVADREPIDWVALEPDLRRSDSLSPDDLEELSLLRLLDEIGAAHATLQSDDLTSTPPTLGSRIAPVPDDETLTTWGRYTLEAKVGRGGFGSVYRGWDPVLEMPVAIKILHRRVADDRLTERLLREGRALAQLTHAHVVRVLNVEQHDDRYGLVMEFLRGETLEAMVESRGRMNEREATVIGEDVCRALAAVHAAGLIHRDVKARNIIRDRDGRIVLMDFGAGLSRQAGADEAAAVGTPLYMAPELLRGGAATVASDVYAVGVLLFYLVTRRHPFEATSIEALRTAQAGGQVPSLLACRSDLPMAFVRVVERAVAVDPQERFATPAALLQALFNARHGARDWKRLALRAAAGLAAIVAGMTLAGMLSSGAFNQSFGRQAFATESVSDWFDLGRRSLLMPLVLNLLVAGVVGFLMAARNLLTTVSGQARRADRSVADRWDRMYRRLGLSDPRVGASWLVLSTSVVGLAVWAYWMPMLSAVTTDFSTVSAGTLARLAPDSVAWYTVFRMALSVLVVANLVGWFALAMMSAAHGTQLPRWLTATELALMVLLYGSMQLPYRIVYDADEFPAARWQDSSCFVTGQRADRSQLFCPGLVPRIRVVPSEQVMIDTTQPRESVFTAFAHGAH